MILAVLLATFLLGVSPPGTSTSRATLPSPQSSTPQATAAANSWTNLSPPSAPSPRWSPPFAYDSKTGEFLLFGGWTGTYGTVPLNDTWSYNPTTNVWTNRSPATHPELSPYNPRTAAMVYDSQADRFILFGACPSTPYCNANSTWSYDPNTDTWTRLQPLASPFPGQWFGLVYDSHADRVLLFGAMGLAPDCQCTLNWTWVYDYGADNWTARMTPGAPSGRGGVSMAYDSNADRTLIFGGCISGMVCTATNETWSYDYGADAWTKLAPVSSPPSAYNLPMSYDERAQVFALSGEGGNETWSYNLTTNAWADQRPATSPPARDWPGMAYGAATAQMILFGGMGGGLRNDTWAYMYGAITATAPSAPRNPVATAGTTMNAQDQIALTWQPPADNGGYAITGYRVYRGTSSGAETLLATPGPTLTYLDSSVVTLTTYYYQVSAVNAVGEGVRSAETSATPQDLTPPTVTLSFPTEGATLNSTSVTVRGTASDDVAVQKVEVRVNNGTWTLASGTTSWSATVTLQGGRDVISVRGTDTSGNVGYGGANVTVTSSSPSSGGTGTGATSTGLPVVWIGLGIVAAAVVATGLAVWYRLRKRGKAGPPSQ